MKLHVVLSHWSTQMQHGVIYSRSPVLSSIRTLATQSTR